MIEPQIEAEILQRLRDAEREHDMRILYACESGSRAWGFASPDSDYDVRFIYVRPQDWYLSFDVEQRRDVIEYPIVDDIDCGGWDLRKALHLFARTNGALFEWLVSPIRYIETGTFRRDLAQLAVKSGNQISLCYHYSHMARRNAREYLEKDRVRLKKYFYVLRPLLAIRYIERYRKPPPIEFESLVKTVAPSPLVDKIEALLAIKRAALESGVGAPVPELNDFIEEELERHGHAFKGQGRPQLSEGDPARDELNRIFRRAVSAVGDDARPA
ncbi:MAG: nucleotidyltransferase domain-containing protein [Pseudomonadota bacterium]